MPKLDDLVANAANQSSRAIDPGPVAVGTWSGGRFMRFGEPLDDERFLALIAPDESIRTVMTADVYGTGEADLMLGRAIAGRARSEMCVVGAVGHDFYFGERDGPRGFPRFTDRRLRDESGYGDYLRMATERSLERCGRGCAAAAGRSCRSRTAPGCVRWPSAGSRRSPIRPAADGR